MRPGPLGLALVLATPLHADWAPYAFDNGAWFEAGLYNGDAGLTLHCGGVSPQKQPLPRTDEPRLTQPYQMHLMLSAPPMPRGTDGAAPPGQVVWAVGETGYILPAVQWDVLSDAFWLQPLEMGDTLIRDMLDGGDVQLLLGGERLSRATDGAKDLQAAISFCADRWQALGTALPPISADMVAASPQRSAMEQAALDRLGATCADGVQSVDAGALVQAEIDGDGQHDIVAFWDKITCAGSLPRPVCGASQCAIDVFLSSSFAKAGQPQTVYGATGTVIAGPAGRHILQIVGRLATCSHAQNPNDCTFDWGWTGTEFDRLR